MSAPETEFCLAAVLQGRSFFLVFYSGWSEIEDPVQATPTHYEAIVN